MRKGAILYLVGGNRSVSETMDLEEQQQALGVDALCLAISEFEVAYNWWYLLARGMQEICCIVATYEQESRRIALHGVPLRLCG